jgi:CheY-like chemotaxis protein
MKQITKIRILYIDQNILGFNLLRAQLGFNYEIVHARKGREALHMLRMGVIDWVVMDYQLQDMNGSQFMILASRKGFQPSYVLVSQMELTGLDWEKLRPLGVAGHLNKPLETLRLREILEDNEIEVSAPLWESSTADRIKVLNRVGIL